MASRLFNAIICLLIFVAFNWDNLLVILQGIGLAVCAFFVGGWMGWQDGRGRSYWDD